MFIEILGGSISLNKQDTSEILNILGLTSPNLRK
jgi:hypothetical protein